MSLAGPPLLEAILFAAISTFVEGGYDKTSMDEIAARAGTTKRTVYSHFGNKEKLFRAAISQSITFFHKELPPLGAGKDPAEELETFATRLCELCTWDRSVLLQRIAMGEASRFPELSRLLHRDVIERTEHIVADYIRTIVDADGASAATDSSDRALAMASLFVNMSTGAERFAALLQAGTEPVSTPDAGMVRKIDRYRIRLAVQVFLSGLHANY